MTLKEFLKKENMIFPNYNKLNIVDLVRTLYLRFGIDYPSNEKIKYLDSLLSKKKHTLFILVDGMGSNLIDRLDDSSVLKKNKKLDILTVSPSTTGCVLTSVATGDYPINHGVIGWYSFYPDKKFDYYPLLFCDRKDEKSLKEFDIEPSNIYKMPSVLNKLGVKTTVLYPDYICNSVYSKYVADDDKRKAYSSLEDAFSQISKIVKSSETTFTYLYLPNIDSLEHDYGVYSNEVRNEINNIEKELRRLDDIDELLTVITADHGQTNINQDVVMDFSKYEDYFYGLPSIDFGMASYYVKEDKKEEFVLKFNQDYQDKMFLFETEEFLKENIFGKEIKENYMRDFLGEYISICKNGNCFVNTTNLEEYLGKTLGNHSGLSKDEMIIPVIIIDNLGK